MPRPDTVVFDTDCVLCSGMIRFILAHERDRSLRFVGAWSEHGLSLAARHGFTRADLDNTFLVLAGDAVHTRSDAGLLLLGALRSPWRWLAVFQVVPRPWRDAAYSLVARHRYRWFGQAKDCMVVPPGDASRFLGVSGGRSGPG